MRVEVAFSKVIIADKVSVGQVEIIKPQNSYWKLAELKDRGTVELDITDQEYRDISEDMVNREVDDTATPTTIRAKSK